MNCVVVTENAIFRTKLEEVLALEGFVLLPGAERPDGLAEIPERTLVVLDLSAEPADACAEVARWKAATAGLRVVALATRTQQERIARSCGALLDGFLLASHPVPVIVGALHAVAADYRVIPAEARSGRRGGAGTDGRSGPVQAAGLSERQAAILGEICRGSTNKEIAKALAIDETTVKVHLRGIYRALGVSNRTQAALRALDCRPEDA